jgi:pSer/pThr/pTyr-binding forkhead associated (FHA) protein
MATLRLLPPSGAPVQIAGETAIVGREPGCEVVVSDGSVSRKHARLEKRPGGWTVVDQGSANGTFLDSQRVAEATLRHGQELRFGAVSFKVELQDDDLEATVVATPSPDATVVASPQLLPTPPLGVPTPAVPPKPAAAAPPPPLPKAAPAPPTRPAPPATEPVAAPKAPASPRPAPPLPGAPSSSAAKDRFSRPPAAAASAPPSPVGQMAAPPLGAKKGKGPIFWVITGCCSCLLLGVFGVAAFFGSIFYSTQAPANAVQTQLADLRKGDLDSAYRRLSPELQAQLPPEQFESLVREHPGLGQNKDATFWNRSVNNNRATLTGVLTTATGEVEPATFELVKEGSDWRITAIRVGLEAQ